MTSFTTLAAAPLNGAVDPTRHVNYVQGMILGVDDFTQEFAYLAGRDQSLARDLIGYGTVAGLDVDVTGTQVTVSAGVALSPRGEIIRVDRPQCADLTAWVWTNRTGLAARRSGGFASVYVLLSYRVCLTDNVPIPGEPCRSEDEALAASRVADDFQLELSLDRPDQSEEDALRAYVGWLGRVQLAESLADALSLDAFLEQIRLASQPGLAPDFMHDSSSGSPPAPLRIPADQAREYLRAAFCYWTTDLRPRWWGNGRDSAGSPPDQGLLLLAELRLPLSDNIQIDTSDSPPSLIGVDTSRRPYLVHLRMLQEWLISGAFIPSDTVTAETRYDQQPPDPGTSGNFSRADHTHGTPPPPTLLGDVSSSPVNAAQGVLSTYVDWLQGWPLEASEPSTGDLLAFVAEETATAPIITPMLTPSAITSGRINPIGELRPGSLRITAVEGAASLSQIRHAGAEEPTPHSGGRWVPVASGGDLSGPISQIRVIGIDGIPIVPAGDPQPGQVLMVREEASPVSRVWQPTTPTTELLGDVIGNAAQNAEGAQHIQTSIAQIQGIPVILAGELLPGQALTLAEEGSPPALVWRPVTPEASPDVPPLVGDVVGSLEENPDSGPQLRTSIVQLQGQLLEAKEPSADQVLTFNGEAWIADDPPASWQPIVAAGRFHVDGQPVVSYNGTQALLLDKDLWLYLITFNGYDSTNTYVVKGTPVNSLSNAPAIFEVISEEDKQLREILAKASPPLQGIAVRVMQFTREPASGFMVEISQFPLNV